MAETHPHAITDEVVADLVKAQLPQMVGQPVHRLSVSDFSTWQVGTFILRFAFDAEGDTKLRHEARALQLLSRSLPTAVPDVSFLSTWNGGHTVAGHTRVDGLLGEDHRPPWPSANALQIASELASVLATLHSIPRDREGFASLPVAPSRDLAAELAAVSRYGPLIRARAPDLLNSTVLAYLEGRVLVPQSSTARVLSHGDLKGEHLLLDAAGTHLIGVIDWADICWDDAAVDVGGLAIWLGPGFVTEVATKYTRSAATSRELVHRGLFIRRATILRGFGERLRGENQWPLDLARSMVARAFN